MLFFLSHCFSIVIINRILEGVSFNNSDCLLGEYFHEEYWLLDIKTFEESLSKKLDSTSSTQAPYV